MFSSCPNCWGAPVVPTIARSGKGRDELIRAALTLAESDNPRPPAKISYGVDVDTQLDRMGKLIEKAAFSHRYISFPVGCAEVS